MHAVPFVFFQMHAMRKDRFGAGQAVMAVDIQIALLFREQFLDPGNFVFVFTEMSMHIHIRIFRFQLPCPRQLLRRRGRRKARGNRIQIAPFAVPFLNQLQTIQEAYKVQQLQGDKLSAFEALYHATLGGAKALDLDGKLGNFNPGKEADFAVLDLQPTALQQLRQSRAKGLEDALFALMMMGDDRNIHSTYVYGRLAYAKPQAGAQ